MASVLFWSCLLTSASLTIADIEIRFIKWPQSVTAKFGDIVTFECKVEVPGEGMVWRWRAEDSEDGSWTEVLSTNDKVTSKLEVQVKERENRFYQCVAAYGAVSLASLPGLLTIASLDLSRNKPERRDLKAPVDSTVVLHCRPPISNPPAILHWWKEDNGRRTKIETMNGVLVINNALVKDTGSYSCSATNEMSRQGFDLPERTFLNVQYENSGQYRFLETEDYVGIINEGILTYPIAVNGTLSLWCGVVGSPRPAVRWSRRNGPLPQDARMQGAHFTVTSFSLEDEGVYYCEAGGIRRSWKVVPLQPPYWGGSAARYNGFEGESARISCGAPFGTPKPYVYWLINAVPTITDRSIKNTDSELYIEHLEKRHAGIIQCFACNEIGCSYDAALLTIVPKQISEQKNSSDKRNSNKNSKRNKAVLTPPSRPNVTRMSDESVMVSWKTDNKGLSIHFFKVQYREVSNSTDDTWLTDSSNVPPNVHSFEVFGLTPGKYYKFRIAAVYSNQDNNIGKASNKFYLRRGSSGVGIRTPRAPILTNVTALSPTSIQLNWTWSPDGGIATEGFYVYYRTVTSAGKYEKVTVVGGPKVRSTILTHLLPDTGYEMKLQAYTAQAPSEFTSIMTAKTLKPFEAATTTEAPKEVSKKTGSGGALVTSWAAGAGALAIVTIVVLLCRRSRRKHRAAKNKPSSPKDSGNSISKASITITSNPMVAENVEMLHVRNLNHSPRSDIASSFSRKNGSTSPCQVKTNIFDNMVAMMERYTANLEGVVAERTDQLLDERRKTGEMLRRMLPSSIAEAVQRGERILAQSHDSVTVCQTTVAGISQLSNNFTAAKIIDILNELHNCLDTVLRLYNVEKVDTIDGSNTVVSGMPGRGAGAGHATEAASLALHVLDAVNKIQGAETTCLGLRLRIGIDSGPCSAGVIGTPPRYCVFGASVETATRLAATAADHSIHVSQRTYILLRDKGYQFTQKGKGEAKSWLLAGGANKRKTVSKSRLQNSTETMEISSAGASTLDILDSALRSCGALGPPSPPRRGPCACVVPPRGHHSAPAVTFYAE